MNNRRSQYTQTQQVEAYKKGVQEYIGYDKRLPAGYKNVTSKAKKTSA